MPESKLTPEFPPEYTGIRDVNMLWLYIPIRRALDYEEQKIREGSDSAATLRNFHLMSARIEAIQSQRLFHVGYDRERVPRPGNTPDVHYHYTAMGGMQVVFRLSREEHPDYFAAHDRWQAELAQKMGR